jgi:hypothetical protein
MHQGSGPSRRASACPFATCSSRRGSKEQRRKQQGQELGSDPLPGAPTLCCGTAATVASTPPASWGEVRRQPGGAKPQARSNGGGKSTSAGPAPPMAAAVHARQSQLPAAAPSSPHELPWPWVGELPPLEPLTPVGAAGPAASRSDRGSHSSRAGRSRLSTVGLAPASQIDCGPHLQQPTWEAASRRQLRFENSRA